MIENNWVRYERPGDRENTTVWLWQHEETGRLVEAERAPSKRWYLVRGGWATAIRAGVGVSAGQPS